MPADQVPEVPLRPAQTARACLISKTEATAAQPSAMSGMIVVSQPITTTSRCAPVPNAKEIEPFTAARTGSSVGRTNMFPNNADLREDPLSIGAQIRAGN